MSQYMPHSVTLYGEKYQTKIVVYAKVPAVLIFIIETLASLVSM